MYSAGRKYTRFLAPLREAGPYFEGEGGVLTIMDTTKIKQQSAVLAWMPWLRRTINESAVAAMMQ
jgi:hypothetical protein